MTRTGIIFVAAALAMTSTFAVNAQEWSEEQQSVIDAMVNMQGWTEPDTLDLDAWADHYADDYVHWPMSGTQTASKQMVTDGLRQWSAAGNSVLPDGNQIVDIIVRGDIAITMTVVDQNYRDADGEETGFDGYSMRVWERLHGRWVALATGVARAGN